MKIGFYLENAKYRGIDFAHPDQGNPGIGGAEYMFDLISYYYAKSTNNEVFVFANDIDNLSNVTINVKISNYLELFEKCNKYKIDYLICRTPDNLKLLEYLYNYNFKALIWAHNFDKKYVLDYIYKNRRIITYICVGEHHFNLLVGHPIYKKTIYINNAIVLKAYKHKNNKKIKSICFVGSINETKNFALCCKIWRKLYDNGYKTKFNVIGSGKLYNKNKKLGKYNIAKEDYENKFIQYLLDDKGNIIEDVNLYGVLKHKEKISVINSSYLGLLTSETETFGISAIEIESLGVPLVTTKTLGFMDSVFDKNYLSNNENVLYKKCIELFNISEKEYDNIANKEKEFIRKFDIDNIIIQWTHFLNNPEKMTAKFIYRKNNANFFDKMLSIIKIFLYIQ